MALQRGKKAIVAEIELSEIRSLDRAELSVLLEERPRTPIQSLRDTHHRIARAVATGLKPIEIATLCGISIGRLGTLKLDPAFIDLVAHYRGAVTAEFVRQTDSYLEMATGNMLKAEAMLSDKLDAAMENNEFLPTRDLIAISRDAADRFGYGKRQTNLNVNADFAAMLEAARSRSSKARDITPQVGAPALAPALADGPHPAPAFDPAPLPAQGPTQFRRRV